MSWWRDSRVARRRLSDANETLDILLEEIRREGSTPEREAARRRLEDKANEAMDHVGAWEREEWE